MNRLQAKFEAAKLMIAFECNPHSEGPYGIYERPSKIATNTALQLLEKLYKYQLVPRVVLVDGVILKYPGNINVEIDNDGDILVIDGKINAWSFHSYCLDECVVKVVKLHFDATSFQPERPSSDLPAKTLLQSFLMQYKYYFLLLLILLTYHLFNRG